MAKPALPDEVLRAALDREFAIEARSVAAVHRGIDTEASGMRVRGADGREWFAKLRRGRFAESALALAAFLAESGIREVVGPVATRGGRRCATLGELELAVYPFEPGANGLDAGLSEAHWLAVGRALRRIHDVVLPAELAARIRRDGPTRFAGALRKLLDESTPAFAAHRARLERALERLARGFADLRARPRPLVPCHSDVHAANLLLGADGGVAIVDWDEPILAPRERDWIFIAGGYYGNRCAPEREEALFRRGYGDVAIDPLVRGAYACERVIEDLVLHFEEGTADSLGRVGNIVAPGGSLDRALA